MSRQCLIIDRTKLVDVTGPIVKAEHFTQLVEASEVLQEARRSAREIKAGAQAVIDSARRQGYAEGLEQARSELSTQIAQTTARLESSFISLEARIVNTVMGAVQQILRETEERTVMERLIRRVLAERRAEKQLRLRVSASQFDQVNQWLAALLREFPDVEFIDVLKDPNGAHGTCVLESEFGVVDASLETQLAAVRTGLVNAFVRGRLADATSDRAS